MFNRTPSNSRVPQFRRTDFIGRFRYTSVHRSFRDGNPDHQRTNLRGPPCPGRSRRPPGGHRDARPTQRRASSQHTPPAPPVLGRPWKPSGLHRPSWGHGRRPLWADAGTCTLGSATNVKPAQRAFANPRPWLVRGLGPRPWPSAQCRRSRAPLPGPDFRPLCVRGHRNITVYSATRRHTMGHRKTARHAAYAQLTGRFRRLVAGVGFEPT